MSDPHTESREEGLRPGVPTWALVVLAVLLTAILAVEGVTVYLVSELEDQTAQAQETAKTAKTVTATQALLKLVAARQLHSQDVSAKINSAVVETKTLLNETQNAINATNQAIAATNQTLDETNALLDQATAAAAKAQQSAAMLASRVDELKQGKPSKPDPGLAKIQARLDSIEKQLAKLTSALNP